MENKPESCVRCGKQLTEEMFSASATGTSSGKWCLKCYTYNTGLDRNGASVADQLSTTALEAALTRAREKDRSVEMLRKNQQADTIIQNIHALLELVPDHDRTSCSDENNFNYDKGRCTRCALIQAEEDGFWRNDLDLEVAVKYDERYAT